MDDQNRRLKTSTLFRMLLKAPDLKQFASNNLEEMQQISFSEYIRGMCKGRGEVPEHIIRRANLERSYGHQLFKGTRNPSRDTVLQLAFGFCADVAEAQELLKHAGMSALYPRVKRDMAVIYCLHNHFSLMEAQRVLQEMELPLLGGAKII